SAEIGDQPLSLRRPRAHILTRSADSDCATGHIRPGDGGKIRIFVTSDTEWEILSVHMYGREWSKPGVELCVRGRVGCSIGRRGEVMQKSTSGLAARLFGSSANDCTSSRNGNLRPAFLINSVKFRSRQGPCVRERRVCRCRS